MGILKLWAATMMAGSAAVVISATAFAASLAGPLTISLSCDTGRTGSGVFVVTANAKSSTVSVKCGGSSTVSNAAWMAGSKAVVHQTSAATGALRAFDRTVTLSATAQSVAIRNFKPAVMATTSTGAATLAQTGGGLPLAPIGLGLTGLLLVSMGSRLVFARR